MWDFFLELLRRYGLAALVIGLSFAGMVVVIRALWKWNREQAKLIEEGGAAAKLDDMIETLEKFGRQLEGVKIDVGKLPCPDIEDLLESKYHARIKFLEEQVRELLAENRELQKKWREQSTADLREMLGHVNANREAVAQIASAMADLKDLLRRG